LTTVLTTTRANIGEFASEQPIRVIGLFMRIFEPR
jgi:hypothetical protein